ncbi:MAG: hypothetical protein H6642_18330 [Caldilineaceae bacterium]|nr:hypothetical protein [Caldilineaceae bacterium]
MNKLRTLRVAGTPYEMGYAHGQAFIKEIGELTEERLRLSSDPFWTGGLAVTHADVLALGQACLDVHRMVVPELIEEVQGMADATGLGVNELVIMNGFTDFIDVTANPALVNGAGSYHDGHADGGGCTAFLTAAEMSADGRGFVGQTWDMHTTATPYVLLLDVQPAAGPALLTFTITGCVGMIGMNEHGVAVGINNLMDKTARIGVHWVFIVRKMLAQRTVGAALDVLRNAPLSGAHNYVIMGPDEEGELRGYNIEAMAARQTVTPLQDFIVHTNHCVVAENCAIERPRKAYSQASTHARLDQATAFLTAQKGRINLAALTDMTRLHADGGPSVCAHATPEYDIETSGACIMAPATRELWALWGQPCQNEYERFVVSAKEQAA